VSQRPRSGASFDPLLARARFWRHRPATGPTVPADETLLARRPLYVIAVGLLLLALLLRQPLLVTAGLLVGVLALVPEIWYRFALGGLAIRRAPAVRQAMFGDTVEVSLTLENRLPLPLPWVEVADEFPAALPLLGAAGRVALRPEQVVVETTRGIWAYQRVRRRLRLRCAARGAFRFGPMTVRATDPFGILTREERREEGALLLVYPLVAPIERFGLPARSPFGEQRSAQRLLEDPLRVAGVRDYEPGDEPRRIHWKATARLGRLQSKVYEPATRQTLAIFLDTRTFDRAIFGYDPLLVELAIAAAASVGSWGLERGMATGIYANGVLASLGPDETLGAATPPGAPGAGTPAAPSASDADADDAVKRLIRPDGPSRLRIPPAASPAQLTRILDGLARVLPFGALPMEHVLAAEHGRLPPGSAVVYIGAEASVDVPLIIELRRMQATGHRVTLLLTGLRGLDAAARPGAEDATMYLAGLKTHRLGGRELWNEIVEEVLGRRAPGGGDADAGRAGAAGPGDDGRRGAPAAARALVVE
jgi:uncharacterized protein (DUF58 family)